jgi:fumarylacetoacetate (FAA) hydrolase family protein
MKEKEYLFVYSETAAKKNGFNLVTLKNGEVFKATLVVDIDIDLNDFYRFKDKKIIGRALYSEVLSNIPSKEIKKAQEKDILKRMEFPAIKEIISTLSQTHLGDQKKHKAKIVSEKIKSML